MLGIAPNWAPCVCNGIAHCLRPGGRFVTVNCSPALDFRVAPSYRKYGFDTSIASDFGEGAPIKWTFFLEDGSFEIENYFLDVPMHEEAFRSAGFREIRWHGHLLSLDGEAAHGRDFWASFLAHSPIISSNASSEKMNRGPPLRASWRVERAAIRRIRERATIGRASDEPEAVEAGHQCLDRHGLRRMPKQSRDTGRIDAQR
jgi:hypothetical protein